MLAILRQKVFLDYSNYTLFILAFLMPLKLSWTYIFLVPALLLYLSNKAYLINCFRNQKFNTSFAPLLIFFISAWICSLWGIKPENSSLALIKAIFFSFTIGLFYQLFTNSDYRLGLVGLIFGQSIAAMHTVLSSVNILNSKQIFIGTLTESGQLILVIICCLALAMQEISEKQFTKLTYLALAIIFVLTTISFFGPKWLQVTSIIIYFLSIIFYYFKNKKSFSLTSKINFELCLTLLLPILICALMLNLKRGPWVATLLGSLLLLFFYKPRHILLLLPLIIVPVIAFEPIKLRLLQSEGDFFITGGRNIIWQIGTELAMRYPLGIGYDNAEFLRKFAFEIPPQLNHFHNNFLNILIETGWICFAVFLWWLYKIFSNTLLTTKKNPLLTGIGCAIFAWQLAGLVEYNFGDSEILNIVYLLLAISIFINSGSYRESNTHLKLN